MIKFSVVIPLYNKEKEIFDTLTSVMKQRYDADEVIIVDDGSTDKSIEIINQFPQDKIRIVQQKNAGETAARNNGVALAKNEYVALLDADDLWDEGFLEEISILIQNYPEAGFYSTASQSIDENGNRIKNSVDFSDDFKGLIEDFPKTFSKNYGLVNSSSVCIRKSIFDKGLIFPVGEKKGGDLCYWLEYSLKTNLAFSAKPLSIYKLNASNRSVNIHKEAIIPCPLKWFYKNKNALRSEKNYKSIRSFIHSNIIVTVYGGFALDNNYRSITAVINLMKENHDGFHWFLYPAYIMPVGFLDVIKKIRRKMR